MSIFTRIFRRDNTPITPEVSEQLLQAILGNEEVSKQAAMSIPAVAACVNKISETVASLEVKLYRRVGDNVEEVEDVRCERLNGVTNDTLTGYQLKAAMVRDMLLGKGGYCFVHRVRGEVRSLNYVPSEAVYITRNEDLIYKKYRIQVQGKTYQDYEFIKLLRNTNNGWSGHSIIHDSNKLFQIVVNSQDFEKAISATGGAKKGFFRAKSRMSEEAISAMRDAYRQLYVNGSEAAMVLNEGMDFQEVSASAAESQLNENKETNNNDICKIFGIPPAIINGGATKEDRRAFYEGCIYPILTNFSRSLNDVLLNPYKGEDDLFFAFDDSGLTKADIEERYEAYATGIKSGFLQLDEVRKKENMPALGVDFVKLGLQDVLFYPESGNIYTPNMGVMSNVNDDSQKEVKNESQS